MAMSFGFYFPPLTPGGFDLKVPWITARKPMKKSPLSVQRTRKRRSCDLKDWAEGSHYFLFSLPSHRTALPQEQKKTVRKPLFGEKNCKIRPSVGPKSMRGIPIIFLNSSLLSPFHLWGLPVMENCKCSEKNLSFW